MQLRQYNKYTAIFTKGNWNRVNKEPLHCTRNIQQISQKTAAWCAHSTVRCSSSHWCGHSHWCSHAHGRVHTLTAAGLLKKSPERLPLQQIRGVDAHHHHHHNYHLTIY